MVDVRSRYGEKVGEWVERFAKDRDFECPTTSDFLIYTDFQSHQFVDWFNENWQPVMKEFERASRICEEHFDADSWFITNDGRLWVTSPDMLVMFKLYW